MVSLVTKNMPRHMYSVPSHKVIAYSLWGRSAFEEGIEVRHLDGNSHNNSIENLALGTSSENQLDKPQSIRSKAAQSARKAQPFKSYNCKLSKNDVYEIRTSCKVNLASGRAIRGEVMRLAKKFRVAKSTISAALHGISHGTK